MNNQAQKPQNIGLELNNLEETRVNYTKLFERIKQSDVYRKISTSLQHILAEFDQRYEQMTEDEIKKYEFANKGDGHCFYHTVLRYIFDNKDYLDKTLTELLPIDFDPSIPNSQTPQTIVKLRELLRQYKLNQRYMKEGDKVDTYYLTTIKMAKENKPLTSNLYAGDIDQDEVQHMAEMLNINIIAFTGRDNAHRWNPRITIPYLDTNFSSEVLLRRTLFMHNQNSNHFNTLYTKEQYETLISKEHRNFTKFGGKRKKSYTRKNRKIIKKRKH